MEQFERFPASFAKFSEAVAVQGPGRWIYVSGRSRSAKTEARRRAISRLETAATFDHDRAGPAARRRRALPRRADEQSIMTSTSTTTASSAPCAPRASATICPASAVVQVAGLMLGAAIEIDAVAFVPEP